MFKQPMLKEVLNTFLN